jgi:hypothetical protein
MRGIVHFAPLAAFGAIAFTIGKYGATAALPLLKFLLTIYLASFLYVTLVLGLMLRLIGLRLWRLIPYIKEELLLVATTGSSVAALPRLLDKLETAGCHSQVARLVLDRWLQLQPQWLQSLPDRSHGVSRAIDGKRPERPAASAVALRQPVHLTGGHQRGGVSLHHADRHTQRLAVRPPGNAGYPHWCRTPDEMPLTDERSGQLRGLPVHQSLEWGAGQ